MSIAHFSDNCAQPVAPDLSADAYSAIPMDNSATISSPVNVIVLKTLLLFLCQLHIPQRAESQFDGLMKKLSYSIGSLMLSVFHLMNFLCSRFLNNDGGVLYTACTYPTPLKFSLHFAHVQHVHMHMKH